MTAIEWAETTPTKDLKLRISSKKPEKKEEQQKPEKKLAKKRYYVYYWQAEGLRFPLTEQTGAD